MPFKRKPLGDLEPNSHLRVAKRPKVSEERTFLGSVPSSHAMEGNSGPAIAKPTPQVPTPRSSEHTLPRVPQPGVGYKETRERKRQRIAAGDLPGMPSYQPLEVPFEPHKAQVSKPEFTLIP